MIFLFGTEGFFWGSAASALPGTETDLSTFAGCNGVEPWNFIAMFIKKSCG
jgi:hypothetical protein